MSYNKPTKKNPYHSEYVKDNPDDYALHQRGLSKYGKIEKENLKVYADTANIHHTKAFWRFRGFLMHARKVGEALNRARDILGKRGRWGRWLKGNFKGSKETAQCYARIARQWDDPRLVKARADGVKMESINSVLKILRNQKEKPPIERKTDLMKSELRRFFEEYLAA